MKPSDFSSSNIGCNIQVAARVITPLVALAITTAELVYWLGGELRIAIDIRNDQLAAWWVGVLGISSAPEPVAEPVMTIAPDLDPIPTTPDPPMVSFASAPARKPRIRKAAVAAPPAPPAAPAPKCPRPAKRARKAKMEVVAV